MLHLTTCSSIKRIKKEKTMYLTVFIRFCPLQNVIYASQTRGYVLNNNMIGYKYDKIEFQTFKTYMDIFLVPVLYLKIR
jgi:hypothetical protein